MHLPKIQISQKARYLPLAEDIDFFELFKKIQRQYKTCFFCESLGEQSTAARYSLIGFEPEYIIRAKGNALYIGKQKFIVPNPYEALSKIVPQDKIARVYSGGLFGYISYEGLNYLEPACQVKVHPLFDQFLFGVYTDGLVLDKVTQQLWYFYYDQNRMEIIKNLLNSTVDQSEKKMTLVKYNGDNLSKKQHAQIVANTKKQIRIGNIFQCEVGLKSEYLIKGSAIKIYARLRAVNPSPYMYYLQHNDLTILGSSPELLLQVTDKEMRTSPLAGTIRRGLNEEEDTKLARELLNDQKEIAEHLMLVDLHRNDVGRVTRFGTVKIKSLMEIKKYSHVQHIASSITGILGPKENMFSALKSLLPGGVLSGAPKIESIKIIDANEPKARGPYGGAVGYFGFNGDCTFAIPIRSLFIKGEYGYTQTSSGIVYDSNPNKEYDEIQMKLKALKMVLSEFEI